MRCPAIEGIETLGVAVAAVCCYPERRMRCPAIEGIETSSRADLRSFTRMASSNALPRY